MRADASLEKLAKLKPVFDRSSRGTLTAGNSTPLTDGAATLLLASEEWAAGAQAAGAGVPARRQELGGGFRQRHEGLLMAPAYAVAAVLRDTGLDAPGL